MVQTPVGAPAEMLPRLDVSCDPPIIIGAGTLTTAAMNGAPIEALLGLIDRLDDDPIAQIYDMSVVCQLASQRDQAMALQAQAIKISPLLRTRRANARAPSIRLLALCAGGDLMVNTPLDFITNHLDVQLDLLFIRPNHPLPSAIPDHDVMIVAASEADDPLGARLEALFEAWPRPVLNHPRFLPGLLRDRLSNTLGGLPGLCSPTTVEVTRATFTGVLRGNEPVEPLLPGGTFPVLVRPVGSHAGAALAKVGTHDELVAYLKGSAAEAYYLTTFVDSRGADGLYRKYRVAFIDRRPYLCHMAVSEHWMVHYLNAGMTEHAERREIEADAMAGFEAGFATRHRQAFNALHAHLPFDYYSIDCSEMEDGRLLVFEADTAAIIHLMDPASLFPYKQPQMRRVFAAFDDMLRHRVRRAARAQHGPGRAVHPMRQSVDQPV